MAKTFYYGLKKDINDFSYTPLSIPPEEIDNYDYYMRLYVSDLENRNGSYYNGSDATITIFSFKKDKAIQIDGFTFENTLEGHTEGDYCTCYYTLKFISDTGEEYEFQCENFKQIFNNIITIAELRLSSNKLLDSLRRCNQWSKWGYANETELIRCIEDYAQLPNCNKDALKYFQYKLRKD